MTFKNAKKDDVITSIPPDRLLVETDCPYMTPVPFRGQP
ncbi:MAG: TatD family hydrolase, partial [Clostridia bacterium]|nr:TatD family hydrolase [Clostridia bacterium]